jgi:prephenate dehydrogenase
MRVGVIGLGLIGGSVARELAAAGHQVLGSDAREGSVAAAQEAGVLAGRLRDAGECDVVILAVPVQHAPGVLALLAPGLRQARLVMDVGSTKAAIVAAAEAAGLGERFVGAHPLAGDHRSGWEASRQGLFRDATVFLCPTHRTAEGALLLAQELWQGMGGRLEQMDAGEHDRRLAWSSHLPQLLSTALALTLAEAGVSRDQLGPGGRDMTRLAGSDARMWSGIAAQNAGPIGDALAAFSTQLDRMRAELGRAGADGLRQELDGGRSWFEG